MLVAIIAIYWITGTTDVTQIYEIKIHLNFNIYYGSLSLALLQLSSNVACTYLVA